MEFKRLNNGVEIPSVGYGVYQTPKDKTMKLVRDALDVGYRHIDTAQNYSNEAEVGSAILESGISREDVFVTTKTQTSGYESTLRGIDHSLEKFGHDYFDLILIHWPTGDNVGTYHALEDALNDGKCRAIGLSNFNSRQFGEILTNSLNPDQYNNVTGKAHSGNNFIVATLYGENIEVLLEEGLVIESLYYTNSSYTVNSIVNGDNYSGGPFTKEDWLTCTFVGHHADGTKTSVEVDLASNGKYVKEWKKVNLRPLGKIVALDFVMTGSRTGEYGLNTPAYICLDDIKVQIPYDEILK